MIELFSSGRQLYARLLSTSSLHSGRRAARRRRLCRRGRRRRAAGAGGAALLAELACDWAPRQRLLVRVLAAKAGEAGAHGDELRQLLAAVDFNQHFARRQ